MESDSMDNPLLSAHAHGAPINLLPHTENQLELQVKQEQEQASETTSEIKRLKKGIQFLNNCLGPVDLT